MTPIDTLITIVNAKTEIRHQNGSYPPTGEEVLVTEIGCLRQAIRDFLIWENAPGQENILSLDGIEPMLEQTEKLAALRPENQETHNDPAPETTTSETKASAKHAPEHTSARGGWFHPPIDEDILSRDV